MAAAVEISVGAGDAIAEAQRSALVVLAIRIGGAALAYAVQVLLARLMGRAEYGIFATVWVWVAILGHASLWGLGQAACRFVPQHRARGELDEARGFLTGGLIFSLFSGFIAAGLGGLTLWLARGSLGEGYLLPFVAALFVLPLFVLQDYAEGVARSFGWTALAIAPLYLLRQGGILIAMAGAVLLGAPADPAVAIACALGATAVSLAVQTALLWPRLRRALPPGPWAFRPREWAAATLPIALVDLATIGFSFIDVVLLGLFLPAEAVGVYFAATRILQFVVFVPYAASAATAQRYAEARARGDEAGLAALVAQSARLGWLATLGVAGAVLVAAPSLLALFGPGFAASLPVLAVLVAGVIVQGAFGPAEDLLTMLGAERPAAAISFGALGLAAVLGLALIPAHGVLGAAGAMALANAARGGALALAARRHLGIETHVLARPQ